MILTLSGKVTEKISNTVILEVAGVGYGLFVTGEDLNLLTTGSSSKVYVYEHIREQSYDLFGFIKLDTKKLFELLLGVNGVGPKMALNILSIGVIDNVRQAIATGDVKKIQQASGVGKRVAERVVVELKDKVGLAGVDLQSSGLLQSNSYDSNDEAVEALIALGYSVNDAQRALQNIDKSQSTEERIKQALKSNYS